MLGTTGVAGGRIPPFDDIRNCETPAGIFFICVCTEIGIPFIMGTPI
jgi:hypothetical protein